MSSPAVQFRSRVPRIAEAAVERARLTRRARARRVRAARVPFVTLVSLVLLGGVVGLLLFNTSMQQASFAATSLEDQASTLTAREQTLRMELDVLRNPQRVAEQARSMGMVTAGSPAFRRPRRRQDPRAPRRTPRRPPPAPLRLRPLQRLPGHPRPGPASGCAPPTGDGRSVGRPGRVRRAPRPPRTGRNERTAAPGEPEAPADTAH